MKDPHACPDTRNATNTIAIFSCNSTHSSSTSFGPYNMHVLPKYPLLNDSRAMNKINISSYVNSTMVDLCSGTALQSRNNGMNVARSSDIAKTIAALYLVDPGISQIFAKILPIQSPTLDNKKTDTGVK